jgi:hypothetical protein
MTEHRTSSNSNRPQPVRGGDLAALRELRQETGELRRANLLREPRTPRPAERRSPASRAARRRSTYPRRRRLLLPGGAALVAVVLVIGGAFGSSRSFALPSRTSLAGMSVGQRIVAIANSQVGYRTDPTGSYCNKFSAYWSAGAPSCPGGESSEEWCADFAAWAWQKAGVALAYGFGADELNAGAASFYEWGVAHGTWHPASSGYRAAPGDVAVYGLDLSTSASAAHVAIVTGDPVGQDGPDVINGDGDRTGFSVVETGTDQLRADAGHGQGAPLAGYVSP